MPGAQDGKMREMWASTEREGGNMVHTVKGREVEQGQHAVVFSNQRNTTVVCLSADRQCSSHSSGVRTPWAWPIMVTSLPGWLRLEGSIDVTGWVKATQGEQ